MKWDIDKETITAHFPLKSHHFYVTSHKANNVYFSLFFAADAATRFFLM